MRLREHLQQIVQLFELQAVSKGLRFEHGRVVQSNFHDYRLMRLNEMPKVEAVIVPTGGFWGGVGEPTIAVAAPAVLNAIFAATGKRVRDMPLKNHSLKRA